MPPSIEYLHALWVVCIPLAAWLYKDMKAKVDSLSAKTAKHGRRLAKHKEKLGGIAETLHEVKDGVGKLNDKLDAVIAKKG